MKKISGVSSRIKHEIVGRLISSRTSIAKRKGLVLVTDEARLTDVGYAGIVVTKLPTRRIYCPHIYIPNLTAEMYDDGDIVCLTCDSYMNFIWESNCKHNVLFMTESCSCRCLMCPQPPTKHNPAHIRTVHKILDLVPGGYCGEICITGGEPTLCGDDFLKVLRRCKEQHPSARIIILTNGKSFADFYFTKSVADIDSGAIFAVSLHADTDIIHDSIVGAKGSFRKTHNGIYNIARFNMPIEIRVVVSKMNYARLGNVAEYIYRNYPFAYHVTFMGLEVTGLARANLQEVWIDPAVYKSELESTLHELYRRGMNVSAYNHPLCLIDKRAWKFARQSISSWKQSYIQECSLCSVRGQCCGVFTTSGEHLSRNIQAV